jgi:hypothetical protein
MENYLVMIEFGEPRWIVGKIHISMDAWHKHRERMEEIVLKHPLVSPFYKKSSVNFNDFGSRRKG